MAMGLPPPYSYHRSFTEAAGSGECDGLSLASHSSSSVSSPSRRSSTYAQPPPPSYHHHTLPNHPSKRSP